MRARRALDSRLQVFRACDHTVKSARHRRRARRGRRVWSGSPQGREVGHLVEEALRMYFEVAAITDLDSQDIAETQMALVDELGDITA